MPEDSLAHDEPFCVGVDWGTSSFRLWLFSRAGRVLAESRGLEGMMRAAELGFETVLSAHLRTVGVADGLPIVVCGMAGARQGWREAPYVSVPAGVAGLTGRVARVASALGDVRILPGVSQADPLAPDVMRGEETQLFGLATGEAGDDTGGSRLVCMPGTHCKWVELEGAVIRRFSTFMTGELFDIVGRHSILKHAIEPDARPSPDDPAFLPAARHALSDPDALTAGLFGLRAGQLLGFSERADGAAGLSGLLIGAEVAVALRRHADMGPEITLLASGALGRLYEAVLRAAGRTVRSVDVEAATRRGLFEAARHLWPSPAFQETSR